MSTLTSTTNSGRTSLTLKILFVPQPAENDHPAQGWP